jgi:hypothetical protein
MRHLTNLRMERACAVPERPSFARRDDEREGRHLPQLWGSLVVATEAVPCESSCIHPS